MCTCTCARAIKKGYKGHDDDADVTAGALLAVRQVLGWLLPPGFRPEAQAWLIFRVGLMMGVEPAAELICGLPV
jgi:hypothetical protein